MTPAELGALEARSKAATPGPWRKGYDLGSGWWMVLGASGQAAAVSAESRPENPDADAEFAANARVDVRQRLATSSENSSATRRRPWKTYEPLLLGW